MVHVESWYTVRRTVGQHENCAAGTMATCTACTTAPQKQACSLRRYCTATDVHNFTSTSSWTHCIVSHVTRATARIWACSSATPSTGWVRVQAASRCTPHGALRSAPTTSLSCHCICHSFQELRDRNTGTQLAVAHITATADAHAPPRSPRPVVLLVFGEHAREVITSEVAVWLLRLLTDERSELFEWPELQAAIKRAASAATAISSRSSSSGAGDMPAAAAAAAGNWSEVTRAWAAELLTQLELQVVPLESLDGRQALEAGALCTRKTARGVDLNRCVGFCVGFCIGFCVGDHRIWWVGDTCLGPAIPPNSPPSNFPPAPSHTPTPTQAHLHTAHPAHLLPTCSNWPVGWRRALPADEQYGGPAPFSEPQSRLVRTAATGQSVTVLLFALCTVGVVLLHVVLCYAMLCVMLALPFSSLLLSLHL